MRRYRSHRGSLAGPVATAQIHRDAGTTVSGTVSKSVVLTRYAGQGVSCGAVALLKTASRCLRECGLEKTVPKIGDDLRVPLVD
jgi:hypothetical protein